MKKMLLGLFLMLLSLWLLIWGIADDLALFCYISIFLLASGTITFILGFSQEDGKH